MKIQVFCYCQLKWFSVVFSCENYNCTLYPSCMYVTYFMTPNDFEILVKLLALCSGGRGSNPHHDVWFIGTFLEIPDHHHASCGATCSE